jgi:hypothetical protein
MASTPVSMVGFGTVANKDERFDRSRAHWSENYVPTISTEKLPGEDKTRTTSCDSR